MEPCVHRRNFAASGNWLSLWDPAKVCEMTLRNAPDQTLKKLPIFPLFLALHEISSASLLICQLTHQLPQNCLLYKSGWALPIAKKPGQEIKWIECQVGGFTHPWFSYFCADKNPEIDSGTSGNTPLVKMGPCRDLCCIAIRPNDSMTIARENGRGSSDCA